MRNVGKNVKVNLWNYFIKFYSRFNVENLPILSYL